MPKSQLEINIEKATNENNVSENWGLILDIVDQINVQNAAKEAMRIFVKRLNDKDPHVIHHTLTLLNACTSNCNRTFKSELSSRYFVDELKKLVLNKKFPKLSEKLAGMIKTWSNEADFKTDPALNLIPSLYVELLRTGIDFPEEKEMMKSSSSSGAISAAAAAAKKEEEDLAKAIQLSIKENLAHQSKQQTNPSSSSLYSSLLNNVNTSSNSKTNRANSEASEKKKLKALYDFEAAEDNEITFKAGDILYLSDDSDANWWKGVDKQGKEGLFPSNFVTADLSQEIETFGETNNKKVSFNEKVATAFVKNEQEYSSVPKKVTIDENADPTGEIQPDSMELLDLEDQCYMMGPLIDQHLQKIDCKHAIIDDVNLKIFEAFQMYNNLMKESITKSSSMIGSNLYSPQMMNTAAMNYVAAPPQVEAAGAHILANQLNNFANYPPNPTTNKDLSQSGSASALPTTMPAQYQMSYPPYNNPYPTFNPTPDQMNLNSNYVPMNTPAGNFAQADAQMSQASMMMNQPQTGTANSLPHYALSS